MTEEAVQQPAEAQPAASEGNALASAPAPSNPSQHHAPAHHSAPAPHTPWRTLLIAAGIALVLALTFWGAILKNPTYWGVRDWGFHLYMNSVVKEAITRFGQLPFWDPYRCGGNVALAHPEFPGFSLMFLFALLFPTMVGFKLAIVVYAALGLLGAWLVGRQMKLSPLAAALPAILYALNSSLFLYLAEGNFWARAVVWLPWLAYFWLKCSESLKYAIPAGVALLLILLDTNTYLFGVSIFFLAIWAILDSLLNRRHKLLTAFVLIGVFAAAIGAFKVIPMYDFARQFADKRIDTESGYTWKSLTTGLLDKTQDPYGHWFDDQRPFFHHGMYIGWLPLILGLLGILLAWKRWFLWLAAGILALIVSFGKNAFINLYALIKAIPFYSYYHEATRFVPIAMLAFGLFAGYVLDVILRAKELRLEKKVRTGIVVALLAFILFNMYSVNTAVLPKVFIAPPQPLGNFQGDYIQVNSPYGANPWTDGKLLPEYLYHNVWGHRMVFNLYENKGTTKGNCHGTVGGIHAQPSVFENGTANPDYRGEAYLLDTNGTAKITEFTNNHIRVHVETGQPGTLVLNQNYYSEWRASGGAGPVRNESYLLAAPVTAGSSDVTFWYSPRLFLLGLVVSVLAIAGSVLAFCNWGRIAKNVKLLA